MEIEISKNLKGRKTPEKNLIFEMISPLSVRNTGDHPATMFR